MGATLKLTHERVDDVPLLLSLLIRLRFPEILDRHFPPHPLHQGLSNGWLITVWITYILSQADHRKSHVQAWVDSLQHTLETLIGQPIRPVDFSDDRLTLVLNRLSDLEVWQELEADLWHTQCDGYALPPVQRVHLDATTSYGYHAIGDRPKTHPPDLTLYGTKRRDFGASPGESGWNGASRGMQGVKLPPPRIVAFWDDPVTAFVGWV